MSEQWEYFHEVQSVHSELYPNVKSWEIHFESVRDKTTGEIVARFHDKRYAMMFAGSPGMLNALIMLYRIGIDLPCECDEYHGVTCGLHIWLRTLRDTIKSAIGLPIEEVLK